MNNEINPSFFNFVSQMSHILCGSTIVFGTLLLFNLHVLIFVLSVYVIVTGVKEFWYDYHYEDAVTRGSSLLDFVMYQTGAFVALGLFILHQLILFI